MPFIRGLFNRKLLMLDLGGKPAPEPGTQLREMLLELKGKVDFTVDWSGNPLPEDMRTPYQFILEVFAEGRAAFCNIVGISPFDVAYDPRFFPEDPLLPQINRLPVELEIRSKLGEKWGNGKTESFSDLIVQATPVCEAVNEALYEVLVKYGLWQQDWEGDAAVRLYPGDYGTAKEAYDRLLQGL